MATSDTLIDDFEARAARAGWKPLTRVGTVYMKNGDLALAEDLKKQFAEQDAALIAAQNAAAAQSLMENDQ